jgi:hypothetical protein
MEYKPAPEVADIAKVLIRDHHSHLEYVRIEYLYATKMQKSKGAGVWGTARKIGGLPAFLASDDPHLDTEDFFAVIISLPVWELLGEAERAALVDHELCHLWVDEDGKLMTIGHDLEEFAMVVQRHGFWRQDISTFMDRAAQLTLDLPQNGNSLIESVADETVGRANGGRGGV